MQSSHEAPSLPRFAQLRPIRIGTNLGTFKVKVIFFSAFSSQLTPLKRSIKAGKAHIFGSGKSLLQNQTLLNLTSLLQLRISFSSMGKVAEMDLISR